MKTIQEFSEYGQLVPVSRDRITEYVELLNLCFPRSKFTIDYIDWLYYKNPSGFVVGYDALVEGKVIAHYACIPIMIEGFEKKSLLSINTATHPDYQGRGLFRLLASRTYNDASHSFSSVIGVANSKSVKVFLEKLGFDLLGSLDLRFGNLVRAESGARRYLEEEILWRSEAPGRPMKFMLKRSGHTMISVRPYKFFPRLKAIINNCDVTANKRRKVVLGITLDWRLKKKPLLRLPKLLKPAPLHLIFKPLCNNGEESITSWSFPDFDAF